MRTVTGLLLFSLAACASAPPEPKRALTLEQDDRVVVVYQQSNGFTQVLRSPTTDTPAAKSNYYERVLPIAELQQVVDAFAQLGFFTSAGAKDAQRARAMLGVHVNGTAHLWPSVASSQDEMARFHDCLQVFLAVFNGTAGFQRADTKEKEAFLRQQQVRQAREQGLRQEQNTRAKQ